MNEVHDVPSSQELVEIKVLQSSEERSSHHLQSPAWNLFDLSRHVVEQIFRVKVGRVDVGNVDVLERSVFRLPQSELYVVDLSRVSAEPDRYSNVEHILRLAMQQHVPPGLLLSTPLHQLRETVHNARWPQEVENLVLQFVREAGEHSLLVLIISYYSNTFKVVLLKSNLHLLVKWRAINYTKEKSGALEGKKSYGRTATDITVPESQDSSNSKEIKNHRASDVPDESNQYLLLAC